MIATRRRRGQPVLVFSGMILAWVAVRVLAWSGEPAPSQLAAPLAIAEAPASPVAPASASRASQRLSPAGAVPSAGHASAARAEVPVPALVPLAPPAPAPEWPVLATPPAVPLPQSPPPAQAPRRLSPAVAGGHQLLWLAALSQVPLPAGLAPVPPEPRRQTAQGSRWSADGWVLLRRGGGTASLAAIGGSYGASQVGVVLRYRLDRASAHRPSAYLRITGALNGTREQEAAFGLSARPVGKLPIVAMAELRASRTPGGTHLRPAAALVTQLPPLRLPLGMRAEAYGQAGYVGGADATAFADGQLRLDRKLFDLGSSELRAGGGAWGGVQKGASRLDIGPSASLSLHLGDTAAARLSADWRFRLAGRASPSSGPAVTLSAGF